MHPVHNYVRSIIIDIVTGAMDQDGVFTNFSGKIPDASIFVTLSIWIRFASYWKRGCLGLSETGNGNEMTKVVPTSNWLSTSMIPSWL